MLLRELPGKIRGRNVMGTIFRNVLFSIFFPFAWFSVYGLQWLGLAGLIGIPLAHIWVDFSWWWMFAPVAAEAVWFVAVLCVLDSIGG
jgi:hypothetical protein